MTNTATRQLPGGAMLVDQRLIRRAVAAAAIGNVTEWFDFGVYAYLETTIGKVFFTGLNPVIQQLATFGTFAAAFLVRPIGGAFFGPLGDKIGRTRVLATTMIMMSAGTFCIAFIPGAATIGAAAPILLLLGRLLQGFSTGGEYGGAMTFIAEYSADKRRGFLGSWLEVGTLTGYIMGAAAATILGAALGGFDSPAIESWGWRIPFLIAGPLGIAGMYLRMKLGETPAFANRTEDKRQADPKSKGEFRSIFVKYWPRLLACVGLVLTYNVAYYMFSSFIPTYLSPSNHYVSAGLNDTESNLIQIGVMAVMALVVTFIGRLSDRVGRRPIIAAACGSMIVFSLPAVLLIQSDTLLTITAGTLILGLETILFAATMAATLPALFPTSIRQGGLSIGYNVSVSLFGGTTPVVMTALIALTNDQKWPGYYMMAAGVVAAVTVLFVRETANKPLDGSPPAVDSVEEAQALAAASS